MSPAVGRDGQKEASFVHLAPYTKCCDPSEADVQSPTWKGEQMSKGRRDQERKSREKQGRWQFTESGRVTRRHVKRKEPKFLTLSSRPWKLQYIWICLFIFGQSVIYLFDSCSRKICPSLAILHWALKNLLWGVNLMSILFTPKQNKNKHTQKGTQGNFGR